MDLEPFEQAVLRALLAGRERPFVELRRQLVGLSVKNRRRTGTGLFVELSPSMNVAAASLSSDDVRFGDVEATIDGLLNGAGFLLYIDHGRLVSGGCKFDSCGG